MGIGGAKPEPTKLKLLKGIVNKKRINFDEPKPSPAVGFKAPTWLHPEGKKEWNRIASQVIKLGIVTSVDYAPLVGYCNAWGAFVEAEKELRKDGLVIDGKANPFVAISREAQRQIRSYAPELGIGASSRSRIKKITGADNDHDIF